MLSTLLKVTVLYVPLRDVQRMYPASWLWPFTGLSDWDRAGSTTRCARIHFWLASCHGGGEATGHDEYRN